MFRINMDEMIFNVSCQAEKKKKNQKKLHFDVFLYQPDIIQHKLQRELFLKNKMNQSGNFILKH